MNDLIWTRNSKGQYFLGRITSDWRHDWTTDHQNADISNIRDCDWVDVGLMDSVPGKVINSFRPPATVQPVNNSDAMLYSKYLFNQARGEELYSIESSGNDSLDIFNLLGDEDLEDVLGVYLQKSEGCILFPSTCKKDTQHVEYLLWSAKLKQKIGAQVKSGDISLCVDDYTGFEGHVFLFAASGVYTGTPSSNVTCIEPDLLRRYLFDNKELFPSRIQRWMEFAVNTGQKT